MDYTPHLKEEDLIDGGWYRGVSRNADLGRWDAERRNFATTREKFGGVYTQWLPHGHQVSGCFNATEYLGQEKP